MNKKIQKIFGAGAAMPAMSSVANSEGSDISQEFFGKSESGFVIVVVGFILMWCLYLFIKCIESKNQ